LKYLHFILSQSITMPLLELRTNQTHDKEKVKMLSSKFSRFCSEILAKPEHYVMVNLQVGQSLVFAGTDDPAAFAELRSIELSVNETSFLSSQLCSFASEQLDIPTDRIYISFVDLDRNRWGWNGKTFGSS